MKLFLKSLMLLLQRCRLWCSWLLLLFFCLLQCLRLLISCYLLLRFLLLLLLQDLQLFLLLSSSLLLEISVLLIIRRRGWQSTVLVEIFQERHRSESIRHLDELAKPVLQISRIARPKAEVFFAANGRLRVSATDFKRASLITAVRVSCMVDVGVGHENAHVRA